ncbi:MAG: peptidyl-prolyl cis-trans isomerase [Pikeienuella sp.]
MSLSDRLSAAPRRPVPPLFAPLRRFAAEPLVHFLMIGALLYGLDYALSAPKADPRLIRLDDRVYGDLVDIFAEKTGRAPDAAEIGPLADRWVLNESFYREAMALGLDAGDEMIRERVMQKMRVMLQSGVSVEPPDAAALRAWWREHKARYAEPPLISARIARVDGDEARAREWARRFNAAEADGVALPAEAPTIYPYMERPRAAMVGVFGEDFVARIEAAPQGRWSAIETPAGWQAIRLDAVEPGRDPRFEEIEKQVAADLQEETRRAAWGAAVDKLRAGYRVEQAPYDQAAFHERARKAAAAADRRDAQQR